MISESKPGDHYTVVANPKYYRASEGLPYLHSIVFRIVPNQDTILKDLQAGTIDSSVVPQRHQDNCIPAVVQLQADLQPEVYQLRGHVP